jgi:hypothetical protein
MNAGLVRTGNSLQLENEKLKKEIEGYERGYFWTIVPSFITMSLESMKK